MFEHEFFDALAHGSFEADLSSFTLEAEDGSRFEGTGTLSWTPDGTSFSAITNGASHLEERLNQVSGQPGQLIPSSAYLRLTAQTIDGWQVSVERLPRDGFHIQLGCPTVVWHIPAESVFSSVVFSLPVCDEKEARTTLLFSPVNLPLWPRASETTDANPVFGRRKHDRDWLQTEGDFGTLSARKLSDSQAIVMVEHSEEQELEIVNSIHLAFSYLTGRAIAMFGYQTSSNGVIRRVLPVRNLVPSERTFAPPLGSNSDLILYYEAFLNKAVNYFMTEEGREAGTLLSACWNVADNAFTARTLVVCAVVESLARLFRRDTEVDIALCAEQRTRLLQFVEYGGFDKEFLKRLTGFLSNINAVNATNLLNKWATDGYSGISSEDIAAWKALRNPSAHGSRLWTSDSNRNQTALDRRYRVETIINKLVLNAMGYTGHFFDYVDWQHKPVPATNPSPQVS